MLLLSATQAFGATYGRCYIPWWWTGYLWAWRSPPRAGKTVSTLFFALIFTSSGCYLISYVANKYLRQYQSHSHTIEQEVEWLYALDVHANAFFCSFLVTYVIQYFLLPLLLSKSILACIVSNSLYAIATIWYAYITHLGYRGMSLPSALILTTDALIYDVFDCYSVAVLKQHAGDAVVPHGDGGRAVGLLGGHRAAGAAHQPHSRGHGLPLRLNAFLL